MGVFVDNRFLTSWVFLANHTVSIRALKLVTTFLQFLQPIYHHFEGDILLLA